MNAYVRLLTLLASFINAHGRLTSELWAALLDKITWLFLVILKVHACQKDVHVYQ